MVEKLRIDWKLASFNDTTTFVKEGVNKNKVVWINGLAETGGAKQKMKIWGTEEEVASRLKELYLESGTSVATSVHGPLSPKMMSLWSFIEDAKAAKNKNDNDKDLDKDDPSKDASGQGSAPELGDELEVDEDEYDGEEN